VILCVGLSPAWDITYELGALTVAAVNRADAVSGRAGGKATNVARVLQALGEDVLLLTTLGGHVGEVFRADLEDAGVPAHVVPDEHETRVTSTFVTPDGLEPTVVNAPAVISSFERVLDEVARTDADLVVASGSLPQGAPGDAYAQIVEAARSRGTDVIVDTSGPALAAALTARPAAVKPNHLELAALGLGDPLTVASQLAASGTDVVVSLGAAGMLACTAEGAWRAAPPRMVRGNPTGAGDSVVAALARGRLRGWAWPDVIGDAVALAGATVASPVGGAFDEHIYRELSATVAVQEVEA
jgi:tagatose 6-phosphate kinase